MDGIWNSSELLQNIGIVAGLLFSTLGFLLSTYTTWRDGRGRQNANAIAIKGQYWDIWKQIFSHPELKRVLDKEADLEKRPLTVEEEIFITCLILHLATSFRAAKEGEFVALEGLPFDVKSFFSLPIPKTIWNSVKPLQNTDFVRFIESTTSQNP